MSPILRPTGINIIPINDCSLKIFGMPNSFERESTLLKKKEVMVLIVLKTQENSYFLSYNFAVGLVFVSAILGCFKNLLDFFSAYSSLNLFFRCYLSIICLRCPTFMTMKPNPVD